MSDIYGDFTGGPVVNPWDPVGTAMGQPTGGSAGSFGPNLSIVPGGAQPAGVGPLPPTPAGAGAGGGFGDYFRSTALGQLLGMGPPSGMAGTSALPGGGGGPGFPGAGAMSPTMTGTIPGGGGGLPPLGAAPAVPYPGVTGLPSTIPGAGGGAEGVPLPREKPSLGGAPGGGGEGTPGGASSIAKGGGEKKAGEGEASKKLLDALRAVQQPPKPDVVKPVSPALPRPTPIAGTGQLVQLLQQLGAVPTSGSAAGAPISLAQILK